MPTILWALAVLAVPLAASAGPIRATRTAEPPVLDGRVDEAVWLRAEPYDDFVESWPSLGVPASQRTEVRVLYDDKNLYLGIVCFDTEPELVMRTLGRRDTVITADLIEVGIDSTFSRRNAYYFNVTASGAQRDALLYNDVNFSETWDAVWSSEVAARPDGWSVELAIPLGVLHFSDSADQRWGFEVRRQIPRTHQTFDSTLIPRSANASVSRFGDLTGLVDLKPKRNLEVVPFAAARAVVRPQYSDATTPEPRLVDPSLDVGVDLRTSLFSNLTLNATLNPDFGQVEADQIILNLSNSELFFPEKRPFFNQGLDLFEPVGDEYDAPWRLFYSRRIGLDVPIFAAMKVTGEIAAGFDVGVLDAVVLGPADPGKASLAFRDPSDDELRANEATPNRSVGIHLERPLHLSLNDELPATPPVPTNYLAVVVRRDMTDTLNLGVTFTAATPLIARCRAADFATLEEYEAALCGGQGGDAMAFDWNARSDDREWVFLGAVTGSRREGGPANDVLRDGTVMHPGDFGYGAYFKAGKFGGDGWRAHVDGHWSSPRLDLNAMGFLPSQNQARAGATLEYVRTAAVEPLRDLWFELGASSYWSTDGRLTPRGDYVHAEAGVTLPSYDAVGLGANLDINRYDVREIDGTGVPFQRQSDLVGYVFANTDPNRALSARLSAFVYGTFDTGPGSRGLGYGGEALSTWRPHPRIETRLDVKVSRDPNGLRWVDTLDDGVGRPLHLFGTQDTENLSATLRQTVVLTRSLTVQAYAQFFTAFAHYPEYFTAGPASRIDAAYLRATSGRDNYDFHDAALNLNVVLRWEYRLGSTLFVVYSRSQRELGYASDQAPTRALFPSRLGPGPTSDTLLIKWSWWFSA